VAPFVGDEERKKWKDENKGDGISQTRKITRARIKSFMRRPYLSWFIFDLILMAKYTMKKEKVCRGQM
jgi:hypothetical protein